MNSVYRYLTLCAVLGFSQSANADDIYCPPSLGAVVVDGNVLVASACELDGTTVKGNVLLYEGGHLTASSVTVVGNLQATNAFELDVSDSEIDGDIQLDGLVGSAGVANTTVGGSVQLKDNRFPLIIESNRVGSDVQAFNNVGGIDISSNEIDGNLQCKENTPPPTGSNNTVHGNAEDQCANLTQSASETSPTESNSSVSGSANASASSLDASGGGSIGLVTLLSLLGIWMFGVRVRHSSPR